MESISLVLQKLALVILYTCGKAEDPAFERAEYYLEKEQGNNTNRYAGKNVKYKESLSDIGVDVNKDKTWIRMADSDYID